MLKYWNYDTRLEDSKEITKRLKGLKIKEFIVYNDGKEFSIMFEDGTIFSIENWNHEEPTQWEIN